MFKPEWLAVIIIYMIQYAGAGQQCSSCSGSEGADACQHDIACFDNEICYMHNYTTTSGSVLYDFGCGAQQTCHHSMEPIIGRRLVDQHGICTVCCNNTRLCNRDLKCDFGNHVGTNLPRECSDIKVNQPHATASVYTIYPYNTVNLPTYVYCQFDTNGNWTIFQRRFNGSTNFYRDWQSYKNGFGSPHGEYWIGNDVLNELTSYANHDLRIEMEDFDGVRKFAEYTLFHVGDEQNLYRLTVYNYTGDAGDALNVCSSYGKANGAYFTTFDNDNDVSGSNCASQFKGAWWYANCHCSNLNGQYLYGHHDSFADGINWKPFHDYHYSLKSVKMMIKKY